MISDRDFAAKVLEDSAACFKRLNDLLFDAQETLSKKEFNKLRIAVGMVLGELYLQVEKPLHEAHPELEPEQLRDR